MSLPIHLHPLAQDARDALIARHMSPHASDRRDSYGMSWREIRGGMWVPDVTDAGTVFGLLLIALGSEGLHPRRRAWLAVLASEAIDTGGSAELYALARETVEALKAPTEAPHPSTWGTWPAALLPFVWAVKHASDGLRPGDMERPITEEDGKRLGERVAAALKLARDRDRAAVAERVRVALVTDSTPDLPEPLARLLNTLRERAGLVNLTRAGKLSDAFQEGLGKGSDVSALGVTLAGMVPDLIAALMVARAGVTPTSPTAPPAP